jgi:hypothetical protein
MTKGFYEWNRKFWADRSVKSAFIIKMPAEEKMAGVAMKNFIKFKKNKY